MKSKRKLLPVKENIRTSHYGGIFFVALSALLLEFTMTRILSVSLWYHFAFMIISVALLGIGISGVFLSLFSGIFNRPSDKVLTFLSILYGASVILSFIVSNRLPIDPFSLMTQKIQFILLPVYYLVITIPFFFSGLIISFLLSRFKSEVSKLYFFDLFGAGLACFAFVFLIPNFGGNGTIVFVAAFAFLAAVIFSFEKHKVFSLISFALIFLSFIFLIVKDTALSIFITPNKIYASYIKQRPDLNVFTEWNTFSKVDVMKEEEPSQDGYNIYLAIIDEGNATTNIPNVRKFPPPTKPADASNLAFIAGDSAGKVFVIGSGGGGEVLTAFYHNASEVTGVEINGILNNLISDILSGWTGPLIKNNSRVSIVTDDARSYIRKDETKYNVIISAHTISASAVSSGAMTMVENYIMTREAVKEYILRLEEGGVLYLSRPETQIPKIITTIKSASEELGISCGKDNFIVFRRPPNEFEESKSYMAGVVYKKNGFTMSEIINAKNEASFLSLDIEYDPLSEQTGLYSELIKSRDIKQEINKSPGNLRPATDDMPYFDDNFRFSDVSMNTIKEVFSQDEKAILALKDKPVAQVTLLTMLAQIVIVAFLFLLFPAFLIKDKTDNKVKFEKKFLFYFAFIGLGYIMLQISLIQKFTLFLGQPVFTLLTVVSAMLISSGFGSRYSVFFYRKFGQSVFPIFLIIVLLTVLMGLFSPSVFSIFSGFSIPVRIIISVILISPVAFFMGMPFPLGISTFRDNESRFIGISWAVNGFFSVIGTVLTMILSMTIGFKLLFLLVAVIYGMALFFLNFRLKRNLLYL